MQADGERATAGSFVREAESSRWRRRACAAFGDVDPVHPSLLP
jgi:hypothetical protein